MAILADGHGIGFVMVETFHKGLPNDCMRLASEEIETKRIAGVQLVAYIPLCDGTQSARDEGKRLTLLRRVDLKDQRYISEGREEEETGGGALSR